MATDGCLCHVMICCDMLCTDCSHSAITFLAIFSCQLEAGEENKDDKKAALEQAKPDKPLFSVLHNLQVQLTSVNLG